MGWNVKNSRAIEGGLCKSHEYCLKIIKLNYTPLPFASYF